MADVICRWRNPTAKTVVELVGALPHHEMDIASFRKYMRQSVYGDDFFRTPYQLACQLGLYYEDAVNFHPRFTCDIDESKASSYLQWWLHRYYAPNPYTKSLVGLNTPIRLVDSIVRELENSGPHSLKDILQTLFEDDIGNIDIVQNLLNNFSNVISIDKFGIATLKENYKKYMDTIVDRNDKEAFFHNFDERKLLINLCFSKYRKFITAIKSKPFLLLAGISGTGKSRIVRELARACWDTYNEEYGAQKPRNFEMVQVKPNWHDSTELMGYVSRVSGREVFVVGDFLKFVARAWEEPEVPYFLCLDEMNLAPVEQYFAEYLSVIESRKLREDGSITTDPIIADTKGVQYEGLIDGMESDGWFNELIEKLTTSKDVRERFRRDGICLPQNLIVIGTVNMDETTYSFSRKVLDRAMTIEMNEFDLYGGLTTRHEEIGKLEKEELISAAVEGVDVYGENRTVCDIALNFLDSVNTILKGTPFSVAYRTRNELLLYVVNNLPYCKDDNGNELSENYVIARALDEITNMKILSRIEGDDTKVSDTLLSNLSNAIENGLTEITGEEKRVESISLAKIEEMRKRLSSGYTSFWS